MRTFRHARLLAAAGITVATLALTACENGTGTKDEGASTPNTATSKSSGSQQSTQNPNPNSNPNSNSNPDSDSDSNSGSTSHTEQPTQQDGDKTTEQSSPNLTICNGSNTRTTARPVSRPLNTMLLTVTNTGSKPCSLMYYPVIRFDEMQWVPQPTDASKPQAVPTLNPGDSGYAGVLLASADGSGDGGTTAKKLTVAFQGKTPNSSGGASATPTLPAKDVFYDSSMSVTYWQQEMAGALS
ncbi:DUF4232 domain-containing protein [Streptomyces sp. GESEQ-35]|uniref:DUF4232 domain-containing protein n=1 Tax=Streptomyces sp. GESEQ-35 TaxID=2812657 RepID=UPI001B332C1A|nr:DUF4232 domain-containing protein [Streptomyces sp. GESEQ-35]